MEGVEAQLKDNESDYPGLWALWRRFVMKKREIRRPFVRQFYRRNKLNFILAFAATVVMAFGNLVISWLLQQIMDLMAGSGNTLSLGASAGCFWHCGHHYFGGRRPGLRLAPVLYPGHGPV